MPFSIAWPDVLTMVITYRGQISDRDVQAVARIGYADPRFDTLRSVLHDFSAIDGCAHSHGTLEEIEAAGIGPSQTNPLIRIAIVTERQDVIDLVRAFQDLGSNAYPMEIFPTLAAAKAWLAARQWTAPHGQGTRTF
jgi:hypothetical protein